MFNVGGLGVDSILRTSLLSRDELETSLGFKLLERNLLVTFHPVTLENNTSAQQMNELLEALASLYNTSLVFTMPNADTDGRALAKKILGFCSKHDHAHFYTSLGQIKYFSCVHHFDGVIGNSSSGLTEVPSFKKGTVNIGDRQLGRLMAGSVINCAPERSSIVSALTRLFSADFREELKTVKNPYGNGGASDEIVKILERESFDDLLKKEFFDIPHN